MDNQILPNRISIETKKFSFEKIIIIVFSIIIIVELIWAGYTFFRNKPAAVQVNTKKAEIIKKVTSMTVIPQKIEVKKGEKFTVSVMINSDVYSDGTDLSLLYDLKFISIVNEKIPFKAASIYNSYPQNKVESQKGVITVSGITDKKGGVLTNGLFGTIEFIAKNPGVSKISIDFTPGSTTDTNIINSLTGVDALEKAENAEVNVLP